MNLVSGLAVAVVAAAVYVGWRLFHYPGGWDFAFGTAHASARADLDRARRQADTLKRESDKELNAAHGHLKRAQHQQREQARAIERRIAGLLRPGRGSMISQLGDVSLHEHSVLVDDKEIPLADLVVRLDHAQHQHFLYLTPADGNVCLHRYPRSDHEEDIVRRFAIRLENAIADENAYRIRATAQAEVAEKELAEVRADTTAQDTARAHISEVEERQRHDTRHHDAHQNLEAARDRWQELTGKRPR
ncbi:hypothetical protein NMG29_39940 [Streptomyces cocklensis]|uniref:Uncharacterized protein n=1 Tax=Actinacidiphila cocklensis TaxID=887465 RepID=A0A9W4DLG6_9ACTN|nr:hypothetical protein [Actinacidiphila cocklensis]MDD1064235.1 hypothetical protein [Actinacidiphila cocklensis]CAG6391818.1 conserved hypothetical protein [Actinacidiphila cocklensis]